MSKLERDVRRLQVGTVPMLWAFIFLLMAKTNEPASVWYNVFMAFSLFHFLFFAWFLAKDIRDFQLKESDKDK